MTNITPEYLAYKATFPKTHQAKGESYDLRLMEGGDRAAILNLSRNLSEADLLFMRRDITQPEAVDEWIHDVGANRAVTILAEHDGRIVGYGSIYFNQFFWSRHLGEIRVMISSPYRNRGLGGRLMAELIGFGKTLPMDKVFTYMAVDDKSAQRMTEELGFKAEALLPDWVKTRDERTHDLVIVSAALANLNT